MRVTRRSGHVDLFVTKVAVLVGKEACLVQLVVEKDRRVFNVARLLCDRIVVAHIR